MKFLPNRFYRTPAGNCIFTGTPADCNYWPNPEPKPGSESELEALLSESEILPACLPGDVVRIRDDLNSLSDGEPGIFPGFTQEMRSEYLPGTSVVVQSVTYSGLLRVPFPGGSGRTLHPMWVVPVPDSEHLILTGSFIRRKSDGLKLVAGRLTPDSVFACPLSRPHDLMLLPLDEVERLPIPDFMPDDPVRINQTLADELGFRAPELSGRVLHFVARTAPAKSEVRAGNYSSATLPVILLQSA